MKKMTQRHRRGRSFHKKPGELPAEHITVWLLNKNKFMVVWQLSRIKKELISNYFQKPFRLFKKVIRIYDITETYFNVYTNRFVEEIEILEGQSVSITRELKKNACYVLELGIMLSKHDFFPILRSNTIQLPQMNNNYNQSNNKEIEFNNGNKQRAPEWTDYVSTYSYYEEKK